MPTVSSSTKCFSFVCICRAGDEIQGSPCLVVFWEGAIFTANFLLSVYNILTVWALRGCIFYQFDNYVKNQRCGLKSLIKVHFLAYKKAETTDSKKLNPFPFLVLETELKAFHVVKIILPQNYIVPVFSTGLIAH